MPIEFEPERWARIRDDYSAWWAGELDRPLIQLTLRGADPGRPEPGAPVQDFTAFYDFSVSPETIVDHWDYQLSGYRYAGDAFPTVWPNFGSGVVGAFLGAALLPGMDTCWFQPPAIREIADIRFRYDPGNAWLGRVKEICRAAVERWQGQVQVGMTDLGGTLDILSTFRPGAGLPLDLIDQPDRVKRLTWEAHELWWRYFDEIDAILRSANPGYTAWTPIFSVEPYYLLQCDFCYMIGPDMFNEFVKPELAACCRRLTNPFYHMDGTGQLPHLEALLSIEELKGIQWIPGAGQPELPEWTHVQQQICESGKLIQLWGDVETLEPLVEQLGSAEKIYLRLYADAADADAELAFLDKYGAR